MARRRRRIVGGKQPPLQQCFVLLSIVLFRILFLCAEASLLRSGSICHPSQRLCTNPYYYDGGCLTDSSNTRVCSSTIHDETAFNCTPSFYNNDDDEIRIYAGPSDSSLILAWIYQILLMERLQVPVVVVSSSSSSSSSKSLNDDGGWDFYQPINSFPVEIPHPMVTMPSDDILSSDSIDIIPLVSASAAAALVDFEITGTGLWGQTNLYVPQITAQRYPGVLSYYGLQQQYSPSQLAEIFSQPFSWREYCDEISISKCEQPDDVAQRRPATTKEANSYYHDYAFRGFFSIVQQSSSSTSSSNNNNSTSNVGHVIAPYSSSSEVCYYNNIGSQLLWNNISLQPQGPLTPNGGYEIEHMIQIWKAANATGSNVLMWWWTPDSLLEAFVGSDYAFVPILLPDGTTEPECSTLEPTRKVSSSTTTAEEEERCSSPNFKEQEGLLCGDPGREMQKAIAYSLKERTINAEDPISRNPAYETINNLHITNRDIHGILQHWGRARYDFKPQQQQQQQKDDDTIHHDRLGFQTREAVCLWVTEHLKELEAAFPAGYPRIVSQQQHSNKWTDAAYLTAAQVVGAIAAFVVMLTGIATVHWKGRLVVVYAQVHFVWQVLLGLWFISLAAILLGKEPSDSRCLLAEWLSTMGFTFVMVPLVVKIATINHIAQTMRKQEQGNSTNGTVVIRISPIKMFLVEMGLSLCAMMYLMVWTAYDPPSRMETQVLTGADGNIVETTISCSSEEDGWTIAILCWQGVLLVCGTVLAILTEQVVKDFKESSALGQMIFCQDLFFAMRVLLFLNRDSLQPCVYNGTLSFFLSMDALLSTAIYFAPLLSRVAAGDENCEITNNAGQRQSPDVAASPLEETMPTETNNPQPDIIIGMGSANSADLSILIQNRLRDGNLADDGGSDLINAQCRRGADS